MQTTSIFYCDSSETLDQKGLQQQRQREIGPKRRPDMELATSGLLAVVDVKGLFHQQAGDEHNDLREISDEHQHSDHRKVKRNHCAGQTFYRHIADGASDE